MPSECCRKRLESAASCTSLGITHLSALGIETTQIYVEATLAMKEQALAKTIPPTGRNRPLPTQRSAARVSGRPVTGDELCRVVGVKPPRRS